MAQPASGFGSILIRLGAGDGSFGALQTFPLPSTTLATIGLAELDGDAEAELLVGGTEETPVFVNDLVGGAPVFKEAHDCGLAPPARPASRRRTECAASRPDSASRSESRPARYGVVPLIAVLAEKPNAPAGSFCQNWK